MKYVLPIYLLVVVSISSYAKEVTYQGKLQEAIKGKNFNGVVLLKKNNELVLEEYIGFADLAQQNSLGPQHIFSPGSVAKEFTTVSIMQLVAKGKLNYQDKLSKYLDILPEDAQNVTIEHILSHTSGFPKIKWKKSITTADVVEQIQGSSLSFAAGKGYLYSNINVLLRALLVEKLTQMPYASFLQSSIFKVAKMAHSYQQTSQADVNINQVEGDFLTYLTGVTIYVTPLDLLKFEQALWSGRLVDVNELKNWLKGDKLSGQKHRAYFDFGHFKFNQNNELVNWQHDGSNPNHHTLKVHDFVNGYILIAMSSDGNKATLYDIRNKLLN